MPCRDSPSSRKPSTSSSVTYLSVPSFMSATTYLNRVPVWKYKQQALEGSNLVKGSGRCRLSGRYGIGHQFLVELLSEWKLLPASPIRSEARKKQKKWHAGFMLDLSLFRSTPHFVKKAVYNQQAWWISSAILESSGLAFKHFSGNEFLSHFTERSSSGGDGPVYKYIHLITPHPAAGGCRRGPPGQVCPWNAPGKTTDGSPPILSTGSWPCSTGCGPWQSTITR